MTLSQAIETHLHHLRSERLLDVKTVNARRGTLRRFRGFMPVDAPLSAVTAETLRAFLSHEAGESFCTRTIALRRTALAQFCAHMYSAGLLAPKIAESMPRVPRSFSLPKPASVHDIEAIVDSITGTGPRDLRDRAMVELAYSAGLRASELMGLTLERLDLSIGEARVTGKGNIERLAPVGERACAAITRYLKDARPLLLKDDSVTTLFLNVFGAPMGRMGFWLMLKVRSKQAGLTKAIHPHMLRHSCATHMLDHGADLRVVQETLGHRSISSTQVYTLVTRSRLRAEHRKHHPRG